MNKSEIQALIEKLGDHRYGRVKLPYGLATRGVDRTLTTKLIFPSSLKGKTVLEIGSAFGAVCFEAEELGAKSVTGWEIKKPRYARAQLFRKIKGSKVLFENKDALHEPLSGKYDYVLILNVLHHLKEHAKLLERVLPLAKEKLIIEGPEHFQGTSLEAITERFPNKEIIDSPLDGPEACKRKIVKIDLL